MDTTFSFGYWVRRRRMALNLTQAALAQHVGCATVSIKKIERDERRPSRTMAERLAECLVIAPPERERFIRGALGEAPVDSLPIAAEPIAARPPPREPPTSREAEAGERPRFVGRERELAWLEAQLEGALHGQGRVVFIAGGGGRGKTALMAEFVRRAVDGHPELLVAGGACNAFAGAGDPYLPFREILGTLTGDAEAHWTLAARSAANASRLWQALPTTLQLLIEHGPQLIDVFVPARGLLARAQTAAPGGAGWISQLGVEVARLAGSQVSPEQNALFGQFTEVLRRLAEHHPLLISLDDLHWADEASLALLFHLGRRLPASRILIAGAYRPEELALPGEAERHPLPELLSEVKRTYGDVWIDLTAADQAGGQEFVNAYLDAEPNRLDQAFRQALYAKTGGHPLYTVELLREMQSRGDLVRDDGGRWRAGTDLDWDRLPARVEAVIAQRLDRLDRDQRDLLSAASVQGEAFFAEVVAQVLGLEEWSALHSLSQQLARRHRLVRARGEVEVAGQYLSPYQFGHALFQHYLYQQLDPGERRRLHGEVANALETLYGPLADEIAAQLARHFQEARRPDKAVEYLRRAGERAIRLSALDEAFSLLNRGLALVRTLPATAERTSQALRLRLALGEAQHKAGQQAEALETFRQAAAVAQETNSPEALARAALGYEEARWRFNLPTGPAAALLQAAQHALGPTDSVLSARVQVSLVLTRIPTSTPKEIEMWSQQALALARRVNDPKALYEALYLKIRADRGPERSAERLSAMDEMLRLAPYAGRPEANAEVLAFRVQEHTELGDVEASRADFEAWQQSARSLRGQPFYEYVTLNGKAMQAVLAGRFDEAERLAAQTVEIGRRLQVENVDGVFGIQMFTIRREQGRLAELAPLVKHIAAQAGDYAAWRPGLALIFSELGLRAETQREFERLAANDFAGLARDAMWVTCLAYLAEVCAFLGDAVRAATLYQLMLPYAGRSIVTGFISTCYGAAGRYLGLLAATRSRWAEAEHHFQEALAMNSRMSAWPWLAHTQHQYAAMLLRRGRSADRDRARSLLDQALETAQRLDMRALSAKIEATRK